MKHWSLVVVVLVAVTVVHMDAHAQSSTAQAEALFRQGKDLIAQGKFAEACAAFETSQKLEPAITTLLNLASCREKNGQLASAWGLFIDAERQTRGATDPNGVQLHQVANDHAVKLEPRLSTLTLNVPAENRIRGLEILRNNEPIDAGAWNKALPVDGGSYKITARAPGNAEWSSTITVGVERDAKTLEIPKLKAAALQPPPRPTSPTSPTSPAPGAPDAPRSNLVPLLLGGTALALGGVAVGLELSARSTYDKAKQEADDAKQDSLWHSANTKRYIAEGLGVAALATAGVAVYLYLRPTSPESPSAQARLLLHPVVTPDHAGLALTGSY